MGAAARREVARRKSVRIGLGILSSTVVLTVFAVTATNGLPDYLPGVDRTTVKAAFGDTGALRVGDDVRIANVRAGFVDSIDLVDGRPVVTMQLNDADVYEDATAAIEARSSLGQKYVELDPGTADSGELGTAVIAGKQTADAVELDEVLDVFDERTRAAAGSMLRQLGGGVGGRGGDLNDFLRNAPELLDDLGKVSQALAADDGADLSALLDTAASLSSALQSQSDQIGRDTRQLADTFSAIATDSGKPIEDAVRQAPEAMEAVRGALESLERPLDATRVAARELLPGAGALGEATPAFRGMLRDAVGPLGKVPPVAGQAVDAVGSLTPAMKEARETVDAMKLTLSSIARIVTTLAPFSSEIVDFFTYSSSALADGDAAGHWLRFINVVSPENLSGNLPFRTPLTHRQPYPAPGEAGSHRTNSLLGGTQ